MDILYITPQTKEQLLDYCEIDLIDTVLNHFGSVSRIQLQKDGMTPSRYWIITDYITNQTINSRTKLSVILSLAAIGGVIEINGRQECGDVNVLNMLNELFYISEEDFDFFMDFFSDYSHSIKKKFSL